MTAGKKPAATLSVLPIRRSPTLGSEKKCEFLDAVFELVENSVAAHDEGAAVGRGSMPLRLRSSRRSPNICSCLRSPSIPRAAISQVQPQPLHATPPHHREQNMQVSQLEMTSDAIDPLHGTDLLKQLCNDHISELDMYVSTAHSAHVTIE